MRIVGSNRDFFMVERNKSSDDKQVGKQALKSGTTTNNGRVKFPDLDALTKTKVSQTYVYG